jgi:DNA-binding NarL/FixJ family response regulator
LVRWRGFDHGASRWQSEAKRGGRLLAIVEGWHYAQAVTALTHGVRGVIDAAAPESIRLMARNTVAAGGCFVWLPTAESTPPKPAPKLSPAQLRVLRLVAAGYSSAEVAERLKLSVRTVETHRHNILRRTGLKAGMPFMRLALGLFPKA